VLFSILVYTVMRMLTVNPAKILIVIWETMGMLPPVSNNALTPLETVLTVVWKARIRVYAAGKWRKEGLGSTI